MTLLKQMIEMNYEEKLADSLIRIGSVFVDGEKITMPQTKIKNSSVIKVKESKKYVSRGAYKLLCALEQFNINPNNLNCLDIGSSTGGFTQVLLEQGASFVYALDVGTNQLDYKLRINPKVKVLEKTNLKLINNNMFDKQIDFIVTDVSFISLKHVFNVIAPILKKDSYFIALIKPQFEANSNDVSDGGFVRIQLHDSIIIRVIIYGQNDLKFI